MHYSLHNPLEIAHSTPLSVSGTNHAALHDCHLFVSSGQRRRNAYDIAVRQLSDRFGKRLKASPDGFGNKHIFLLGKLKQGFCLVGIGSECLFA